MLFCDAQLNLDCALHIAGVVPISYLYGPPPEEYYEDQQQQQQQLQQQQHDLEGQQQQPPPGFVPFLDSEGQGRVTYDIQQIVFILSHSPNLVHILH